MYQHPGPRARGFQSTTIDMASKKKPTFSAVSSRSGGSLVPWLGIAFIVILLDQISKITITRMFAHGQEKSITSFFNLVLAYNEGAAFSAHPEIMDVDVCAGLDVGGRKPDDLVVTPHRFALGDAACRDFMTGRDKPAHGDHSLFDRRT